MSFESTFGVDVKGIEELNKKLDKLSKKDAKAVMRKGTRAGAKLVKQKLRAVTPVRTGAARKAIQVRAMRRSRKYVGTTARYVRPPGADILYIAVVNYGLKKSHKRGTRFMNKAAEEIRPEAQQVAIDTMLAEIEKIYAAGP